MHVFGDIPQGDARAEVINTILRFDSNNPLSTRNLIFQLWGEDLQTALKHPGQRGQDGRTYSQLLLDADRTAHELISRMIDGENVTQALAALAGVEIAGPASERFHRFEALATDIDKRISDSDEIGALLSAMAGGHVPAGPSGYLSRGRYDILPTGRNFYNVDPTRIPTRAACRVGVGLAEALLKRHLDEEGVTRKPWAWSGWPRTSCGPTASRWGRFCICWGPGPGGRPTGRWTGSKSFRPRCWDGRASTSTSGFRALPGTASRTR